MAPKRNKQSEIFKQRQKELRRKSNPYGDSQMMQLHQQINEEYRVSIKNSIQNMVNKLLNNGDHEEPTVTPNSTSDTMVKTSTHLNFNSNKYFETDQPGNVIDNARHSKDSCARMVNDAKPSKID